MMIRIKKRAHTKNAPTRVFKVANAKRDMKQSQSYISLLYGIGTVIVLFIIVVMGLQFNIRRNQGALLDKPATTGQQIEIEDTGTYTVKAGDTLWSIAESQLKSGYRWREIASANNITNPGDITTGQKLTIPEEREKIALVTTTTPTAVPTTQPTATVTPTKAPVATATVAPTKSSVKTTPIPTMRQVPSTGRAEESAPSSAKITTNTYTVQRDDTLWDISVRAYGTGFRWKEIADANKLVNPRIIHHGNVLTLPR